MSPSQITSGAVGTTEFPTFHVNPVGMHGCFTSYARSGGLFFQDESTREMIKRQYCIIYFDCIVYVSLYNTVRVGLAHLPIIIITLHPSLHFHHHFITISKKHHSKTSFNKNFKTISQLNLSKTSSNHHFITIS